MATIEVFGRRNSANVQKVMWTLGELGLDYRRHDVGGSFGYPDDYLDMNPNRLVPTIRDGELTLWESNACVRYLARRYGRGTLWPDDDARLALADQWMAWQRSEFYVSWFKVFFNKIRAPAERVDAAAIESGVTECARLYQMLDQHLAGRDFIAGDSLTIGDIPVGAFTYRFFTLDIEQPAVPHVHAWFERLCERPAYQKHVMIPFGNNADEWLELEKAGAGVQ